MTAVVYGAGALAAAQRLDVGLIDLHTRLLEQRTRPVVPAAALARVWHGRSQHLLGRVLAGCVVLDLTPGLARAAGELCAATGTDDLAAATAAITAVERDAVAIVDGDELAPVAGPFGERLRLHRL